MGLPSYFNDNAYNRYNDLDGAEWRVIDALVKSDTKYGKYLWKMLKYNKPDCLSGDEVSNKEKYKMIYRDDGEASKYKVFMLPFIDDGWTEQSARLDVYVNRIAPFDYVRSTVDITIEVIVHNKINNIYGDADEDNPLTNPTETDEDGNILIPSKSRATTMLKCILAILNGLYIDGVGTLQCNEQTSPYCGVRNYVWNNRSYFGYSITFSTVMAQASPNPECGW